MTPLIQTLQAAHACIHADRTSLADSSMRPDNTMEPDDAAAVAEYDAVLAQITGALATLQAQPAQPAAVPISDSDILAVAEFVGLIGPSSRVGDTHNAAVRFARAMLALLALRPQAVPMTLPDFDELPDEAIDNACAAGGLYRADLMRAWESLRVDGITAQGAGEGQR